MNDDFYVAFEEKFRGSEELIKERQKKYLKFILKNNIQAMLLNGFLIRALAPQKSYTREEARAKNYFYKS